jgi:hypothetical protein
MTAMLPDAFAKGCIETRFEDTLVSAHRLYVGSPEPENRFLLCPLERATDEAIDV